jgi:hypothetical protein
VWSTDASSIGRKNVTTGGKHHLKAGLVVDSIKADWAIWERGLQLLLRCVKELALSLACCSVAAERLATAMGLTVRPGAKPVPTLQADRWTRWLQPPTHNDNVDVELGTQDGGRITVLLASLGRCVTGSRGGWVQKRTSFLERQDECSVTAGQPEQPPS